MASEQVTVRRIDVEQYRGWWRPLFDVQFHRNAWYVGFMWSRTTRLYPEDFDTFRVWIFPLPMVQIFLRWRSKP